MNVKFDVSHKSMLLTSLSVIVLVSSLFVCLFAESSRGASLENAVHVKNETELKNAINNVSDNKSTTIVIDNDIALTESLKILANKNITLTSNKASGFYKLIGADGSSTITVESNGVLKLDGVIVTHPKGTTGRGVMVDVGGTFIMYNGEVSGNSAPMVYVVGMGESTSTGGGVCNWGVFEMYGGKVSNNHAYGGSGGGVYVRRGIFTMFGGEISGNTADGGGGVCSGGTFTMSGGTINNNLASRGGGVYNSMSSFTISGGTITDNVASYFGGGVFNDDATFYNVGGVISGNTAKTGGNNVYPDDGAGSDGSGGNGGSSNGGNGTSTGDGGWFVGGFSLREVVFLCVGVGGLVVGIVGVVLFFVSKKEITP